MYVCDKCGATLNIGIRGDPAVPIYCEPCARLLNWRKEPVEPGWYKAVLDGSLEWVKVSEYKDRMVVNLEGEGTLASFLEIAEFEYFYYEAEVLPLLPEGVKA